MSTFQIARAERLNQEAQAELAAARDLVRQNADRLNDAAARMSAITERRVSGTATAAEAAEYAALSGDTELLSKMLETAKQAEAQAVQGVQGAFASWTEAKQAHERELAGDRYKAVQEKCKEIDAVLCKALGELGRAGRAVGISTLGQCFQKSDTLHRALDLNQTPPAV